jgi:hypothetical protein
MCMKCGFDKGKRFIQELKGGGCDGATSQNVAGSIPDGVTGIFH